MKLEETIKIRTNSENDARMTIDHYREQCREGGYTVKKAGYEYKTKKSKGEIIDEAWVVSITLTYADVWEVI